MPTYLLAACILLWPRLLLAAWQAVRGSRLLAACLLLLAYLVLSGFWSPDWHFGAWASMAADALLVAGFVLGLVLSCRNWPESRGFLFWLLLILICAGFVSSSASVHLYYLLPDYRPLPEPSRLVAMGRLGNPVVASLAYGLVLLLLMHKCCWGQLRALPLWLLLASAPLFAVWLTETRGVYFGLAIAFGSLLLDRMGLQIRWTLLLAFMAAVSVLGMVFLLHPQFPWLLDWALPRSTSMRPEIWSAAISRVSEYSLLFGRGQLDPGQLTHGHLTFLHPHSIFVSSLYFGGLTGLLLLLLVMSQGVQNLLQAGAGEQRSLVLGLITFSLSVLLLDGAVLVSKIDIIWLVFWLPLSLAATLEPQQNQAPGG